LTRSADCKCFVETPEYGRAKALLVFYLAIKSISFFLNLWFIPFFILLAAVFNLLSLAIKTGSCDCAKTREDRLTFVVGVSVSFFILMLVLLLSIKGIMSAPQPQK
jgi:hypothetical protein